MNDHIVLLMKWEGCVSKEPGMRVVALRAGIVQLWLYPFISKLDVIGDADGADENWRPAISERIQIL